MLSAAESMVIYQSSTIAPKPKDRKCTNDNNEVTSIESEVFATHSSTQLLVKIICRFSCTIQSNITETEKYFSRRVETLQSCQLLNSYRSL